MGTFEGFQHINYSGGDNEFLDIYEGLNNCMSNLLIIFGFDVIETVVFVVLKRSLKFFNGHVGISIRGIRVLQVTVGKRIVKDQSHRKHLAIQNLD